MKRCILLASLTLLLSASALADKAPIKFGKVSQVELEMTTYTEDSSAVAVVLCKYGHFDATNFTFTLIRRVKVLKKAGTSYSEFSFPGDDRVDVRGKVFNLENGEIIEDKLKNESIFKIKVTDDYYRMRVAMPNVKVGTVFDIEVTYQSLPGEFAFQEDIPVKMSQLDLEESQYVSYRKRKVGYFPVDSKGNNTFVAENVPGFKGEAHMSSAENFKSKFEFDLLNISIPGYYKEYTTSWEKVNDRLGANVYFGHAIFNGSGYLSDIKKEIEATCTTPLEKITAAHAAIKKIKWNEFETIWASSPSLSQPFKEGKANSADINLMLLQLLLKLDLPALPVVMSTRDNGFLNQFYPSLEKLNYVIVWTKVDDKEILLDATDELCCVNMLPKRALNQAGRLVTSKSGKWIDLKTDLRDHKVIFYDLTLDEELNLSGKMDYARYGYAGYDFRKQLKNYAGDDDFLTSLEERFSGLTITDYSFQNVDSLEQPIKDSYQVKISNKVEKINDMILLNPFIFEKLDDNPFKLEERLYPVDFAYAQEKYMVSKITIPENYEIVELPKPTRISMPENGGSALVNYQAVGNTVMVTYRLKLDKSMYLQEEYPYLKGLYANVIAKHAEPIIIKRIQNEASL